MPDDRESDRTRHKKRRGQLDREKQKRRSTVARAARSESKVKDETGKIDLRIAKLIEQGYSLESVAKRLGVTPRRINVALEAVRRH